MSGFLLSSFPLFILYAEEVVRFFQIRRYGIAEKNSPMQYLIMSAGFITLIALSVRYFSDYAWLILAIGVVLGSYLLYSLIQGFYHLTVYQSSKIEVEEVIDDRLQAYKERLSKETDEENNKIEYIIDDTKEKLTLKWNVSPLNSDYAHTVNIYLKGKAPSELAYEWADLRETFIHRAAEKNVQRRLWWHGLLLFAGLLFFIAMMTMPYM